MLAKTKVYRPSDKEPFMNERQREYFRAKLLAWREDILKEAKETLQHLQEESENHPDIADRASSETDRAIELRARDRQRKLIAKIDEALTRIDDVSVDRQNRDTGVLERTLDEEAPRAGRLHAARTQDEGAVDSMLTCLVHDPLCRPRRIVQVLVEACRATGQRRHWIVEAIADVAVGAEREVHRPDEDRAV